MAASALSGICNLAPPNLPNHRERDPRKSGVREHDSRSRMLKHGKNSEVHHLEQSVHSDGNRRPLNAAADANPSGRISCSCGMESASSQCASTSGQPRRVSVADSLSSTYKRLASMYHKSLSMKKVGKGSHRVSKERHQKQPGPSEKWGMDVDIITEDMWRQKRRAALAAFAVAGYISLILPSSAAAADVIRVDFPAPVVTVEALEAQFKGSIRKELEREIQIQRKEWGITSYGTTQAQRQGSQNTETVSTQEVRGVGPELVQDVEEDAFQAWKQVQREIELEGEKSAVPVTQPVHKSPVKKVVAASVAVAVAGSVAGAASAAGRVVASSGGSAVATSLTALQHSSLPGSSLLSTIAQHLGGGGVAGAVGATVVYPLDTIKTRMQAQSMEGEEPQYKDEIDCFKQLVAKEGPASLYSGLVPQLLGIAPEKAMKLTVNEALLSSLETMMPGARIWALEFIAGGGGGASQVVFTNPMEIVKVRLQTQQKEGEPKGMWEIVKELGVRGLYEGAGVTLARDVPSSAVFFACYTLLRQHYPEQSFLAGCIAAVPATILVTPMDIIKTRLQKEPAPGEQQYTDWWQCLQDIVQKEGPQALFKGSLLRVLRTSPQFGITLMLYGLLCEGS